MATTTPAPINCANSANANTTFCVEQAQRNLDIAFATSLLVNAVLFIVFGTLFLIFYHVRSCKRVYVQHTDVPEPARGLLGWARSALAVSDAELEVKRGLDEVVYLRVLKYMFFLSLAYGFYGWLILIPVHATAGGGKIGTAQIGLGNVPQGSPALAADIIGVFFNSILAYIVLYMLYREYVAMRIRYRARHFKPENYTVMLREFPRNMSNDELRAVLDRAFPGTVAHIQRAYLTKGLMTHLELRQKMGLKLELAYAEYRKKGVRPLTRTIAPLFLCGPKADAIDFFRGKFQDESAIVEEKIRMASREDKHLLGTAFVTFTSRSEAQKAAQTLLCHKDLKHPLDKTWIAQLAPPPASVNWHKLSVGHVSRWIRRLIVNVLTFFLVFFWMVPVAFASSLVNLQTLATVLPFLEPLLAAAPAIKGFIEGFLPGLVLIIFFAILVSVIITNMARLEGNLRTDIEDRTIFTKYYLFLVFNVFFGSILASGVISVIGQIIENPASIVPLLAKSLPGQIIYFLSYVMILSLSGFAMALWRPGPLIVRFIFQRCCAKTKRAHRNAEGPYGGSYHVSFAIHLVVFIIVTVYSTLNPLIIPFGCIYFGLAYITGRYNIVYVFTPNRQGEGSLFPSIFTRLVWSLIVYQVSLAGVLGLSLFPAAAAIAALVLASLFFWLYTDAQLHAVATNGVLLRELEPIAEVPTTEADWVPLHAPVDAPGVFPSEDTYKYSMTRTPLFQVEDQDPAVECPPALSWWPTTFQTQDDKHGTVMVGDLEAEEALVM